MESELVAGLCEMWLLFSRRSYKTLSWVLGLIQYRNNNIIRIIGILSDLYWKFVKHVNNIINPYNGYLGYKNSYWIFIIWLYNKIYTWTSKIMGPSERNTSCIDILLNFDKVYLLFEPGSSMFNYYLRKIHFPLFISNIRYWVYITVMYLWDFTQPMIFYNETIYYMSSSLYYCKEVAPVNVNESKCNYILPKNIKTLVLPHKEKSKKKVVNNKIKEKEKTISRSNKRKFIISEKSRKRIILGCKGKTFIDKLNTYFYKWSNYYIIRSCNSSKILLEFHNPAIENENELTLLQEDLPEKILNFLNINKETNIKYNIKDLNYLYKDVLYDKYTHFFRYFRHGSMDISYLKGLIEKFGSDKEFEVNCYRQVFNEFGEDSNITQYYFYSNNKKVYKGWVSVIRIKNYSSAPTYYNNLIKWYHKDWYNLLYYYYLSPIYNSKCNSNTNIKDSKEITEVPIKDDRLDVLNGIDKSKVTIDIRQMPNIIVNFKLENKKGIIPIRKMSWNHKYYNLKGIFATLYNKSQIPNKYRQ
jgi:hypothetical protein